MFLTNKHFIVALIVAPILAIIAYFGVDAYVSEKPHKAVEGKAYPLVAKSNCRYESGKCTLDNGDISVSIVSIPADNKDLINLQLSSGLPLQGVKMALVTGSNSQAPIAMRSNNNEGTEWQTTVTKAETTADNARFQIALSLSDTLYYGETETTFITYQTGFSQENIR